MATDTTLNGAVTAQATTVTLTAYTPPATSFGVSVLLLVGQTEQMRVVSRVGTTATLNVLRGFNGTAALAHESGAVVSYGVPSDITGPSTVDGPEGPEAIADSDSVEWTFGDGQASAEATGGGGTPSAPDTSIQFNDSGAFGGTADLTWDDPNFSVGPGESVLDPILQGYTDPGVIAITGLNQKNGLTVITQSNNGNSTGLYSVHLGGDAGIESDVYADGITTGLTAFWASADSNGESLVALEGVYIAFVGGANVTTAYGLHIESITDAATNYAIKTGLGQVQFGDTVRAAGYKSSDGSTGATGSFTTADAKTVTVKNGLIVSIV